MKLRFQICKRVYAAQTDAGISGVVCFKIAPPEQERKRIDVDSALISYRKKANRVRFQLSSFFGKCDDKSLKSRSRVH